MSSGNIKKKPNKKSTLNPRAKDFVPNSQKSTLNSKTRVPLTKEEKKEATNIFDKMINEEYDPYNINKPVLPLVLSEACLYRSNEKLLEYWAEDAITKMGNNQQNVAIAYSPLRAYKDHIHNMKSKLNLKLNNIFTRSLQNIPESKREKIKEYIKSKIKLSTNSNFKPCYGYFGNENLFVSNNLKGFQKYLSAGIKRYTPEPKKKNKGLYRNYNSSLQITRILNEYNEVIPEFVFQLYNDELFPNNGNQIDPFPPAVSGGAKKKSTTKKKSAKKSTTKKKSVKKSTTKKVYDKRLGMYKHKGHTHRTKKALKACTK